MADMNCARLCIVWITSSQCVDFKAYMIDAFAELGPALKVPWKFAMVGGPIKLVLCCKLQWPSTR
jgi:hypothetical protein